MNEHNDCCSACEEYCACHSCQQSSDYWKSIDQQVAKIHDGYYPEDDDE